MSEIVDYAMPMMRIEILLKKMHNALLDNHIAEAQDLAVELVTEARFLAHTLTLMKEQQDALRQQIKTVQERIPAAASPRGARKPNGAAASTSLNGRQRH
jgi:hypothetical protein